MRTTLLFFSLLLASASFAAPYPARFKGLTKVENVLSTRIGAGDGSFDLGSYLGVAQNGREGSLLGLLGTINAGTFKNGDPNGINFLLWFLAFEAFSNELVLTCNGMSPGNISDQFRSTLTSLCSTQDWSETKTLESLSSLWTELMSYEAPNSEQLKWSNEVQNFNGPNPQRIKFGLMLIFMNPYFLLEE